MKTNIKNIQVHNINKFALSGSLFSIKKLVCQEEIGTLNISYLTTLAGKRRYCHDRHR